MNVAMRRELVELHQAEAMLAFVDAHERETWLQVGMALQSEFGDQAFEAWDRWSSGAANYSERAVRTSWRGFKPGRTTIATLIKLATDNGYRFERTERISTADMAARRAQWEAQRLADEQRREAAQLEAERAALLQWREALPSGRSEYAVRKGIERPESCRFTQAGWLLIPAIRYDLPRERSLKGIQVIRPDGQKRFTAGMAKASAACRLGLVQVREPVLLCEGWATGMTLRMATERKVAVYVAFDAGNLPPVAQIVHSLHPCSTLVMCADDDWKTLDSGGRPLNPGRAQAAEAIRLVQDAGGRACMSTPVFAAGARADGSTDFNDLHAAEGLAVVAEQMAVALGVAREMKRG